MTGVGSEPRDLGAFMVKTRKDITALERRLFRAGALPLNQRVTAGFGIDIAGLGTTTDPLVISAEEVESAPPLPAPLVSVGQASTTITAGAGTWTAVTNWDSRSLTPDYDLWVRVQFTAMPSASVGYVGIGIETSGGVVSTPPQHDPMSDEAGAWGTAPFGYSTTQQAITGEKVMMIPGGVQTTFSPRAVRNTGSGTQVVTYPIMRVIPMYWANFPGPATNDTGWVPLNAYEPGFSSSGTAPNLEYRVKNGVVFWHGGANGTLPNGVYTTVAIVPEWLRPAIVERTGAGFSGGNSGLVEVNTNGNFIFAHNSGANRAWGQALISYPLEG